MSPQPRVIKKYENRRLYDTEASCYVNLERVADLVREGEPVAVLDAKTGEDLTRQVLTQIIVENARDPKRGAPVEFLRDLIRASDEAQKDFLHWYLSSAAKTYERLQSAWSERRAWPPTPRQWETWLRRWDPLSLFHPPAAKEGPEAPEGDTSADAHEELQDLRERLTALERKLTKEEK